MYVMNKFGFLIGILAITLVSCTNQSNKENDSQHESALVENSIIDSHTSAMSLDWAGVYEGRLPCADCEGIETSIELRSNYTYLAHYKYLGQSVDDNEFSQEGTFTWDDMGSVITMESENETSQYKVGENQLILLNADGELNTGELAELYVLKKKM